MGLHDGHRERLKKRFLSSGLDDFEDHNILELLLFFSIPRSDTNEIAHELLNNFGSLYQVFDASVEDLCKVKGVSAHTATLIKLIPALFPVYESDRASAIDIVRTTEDYGRYLVPKFYGKTVEEVYGLFLDDKMKILSCQKLYTGTVNSSAVGIKKVLSEVMKTNATSVVLAHNHPNGVALPSAADCNTTKMLFRSLKTVGVRLRDHIIVADGDYISLSQSGLISELEREN